jgi:hypothetical protein
MARSSLTSQLLRLLNKMPDPVLDLAPKQAHLPTWQSHARIIGVALLTRITARTAPFSAQISTSNDSYKAALVMGGPTAALDVGSDGVAVITLRNAPVNALHPSGSMFIQVA